MKLYREVGVCGPHKKKDSSIAGAWADTNQNKLEARLGYYYFVLADPITILHDEVMIQSIIKDVEAMMRKTLSIDRY